MELIRKVLLAAEAGPPYPKIEGYRDDAIKYHQKLAIDAGLLDGAILKAHTHPTEIPAAIIVKNLTWSGHDFIDAIREDTKWAKVKGFLAEAGKQLTVETVRSHTVSAQRSQLKGRRVMWDSPPYIQTIAMSANAP